MVMEDLWKMEKQATSTISDMAVIDSAEVHWEFKNWSTCHRLLAAKAECLVKIGDVTIRFFLCEIEKSARVEPDRTFINQWYSLCAEPINFQNELCLKVKVIIQTENTIEQEMERQVFLQNSASNQKGVAVVEEEFICVESWMLSYQNGSRYSHGWHRSYSAANSSIITGVNIQKPEAKRELVTSIHDLLIENDRKLFSDVALNMKDGVTLYGHRILLAGASPVFRAMFTTDMQESKSKQIEIPDVSSSEMNVLIEYIFTGKVNWSNLQLIPDIVYAASKYQLSGILDYFDKTLITYCTPDNPMEFLKLAKFHHLTKAVSDVTEYVQLHAAEILMSQLQTS